MSIKNKISRFKRRVIDSFEVEGKKSYSQFGEDIIIETIFYLLKKQRISYLDIGANFPKHFSNTYYFYKKGNNGVCIEPDVELFNYYKKIRPRDKVYNIGIGTGENDEVKDFFFYSGERKGLNTFSEERMTENKRINPVTAEKRQVTLRNINTIIAENFSAAPDLLSIDIEGLDFAVLSTLDFKRNAPAVICCELTTTGSDDRITHNKELNNLLVKNNYFEYANTFINGIFVQKQFEATLRKVENWY